MSHAEDIVVILAVIFAVECGIWMRPGSLLFLARLTSGCRLRLLGSAALLRNDHGGLLFGNFLPFSHAVVVHPWPLSLSPDGVASVSCQVSTPDGRPEEPNHFARWDDIEAVVAEGRKILVNGKVFVRAAAADLARHLAKLLNRIRKLPWTADREAAIRDAVRASLDHAAFDKRYDQHLFRSMPLVLACTFLMAYLFVIMPWLLNLFDVRTLAGNWLVYTPRLRYFLFGRVVEEGMPLGGYPSTEFLSIALTYLQLLGLTILSYWVVHWWLGRPAGERWSHSMMMLVSPADAMHARDSLFRNIAVGWHPLAVARVLADPETFRDLARMTLLDLRFPLPAADRRLPPEVAAAEAWFRQELGSALEHFIAGSGLKVAEVVRPPAPDSAESRSICPRCQGQYILEGGSCSVCALPLVLLGAEPMSEWSATPQAAPPPAPTAPAPAPPTAKDLPSKESPPPPSAAARPARRRDKRKKRRDGGSAPGRNR